MDDSYLLDTQIWLWVNLTPERIHRRVFDILKEEKYSLFLSVASGWEIVIKQMIGKLKLPQPASSYIPKRLGDNRIEPLPLQLHHVLVVEQLPAIHQDPFDRIIVAQSMSEKMTLLTADTLLADYDCKIILN